MQTLSATSQPIEVSGAIGRWLIFLAGLTVLVCALLIPAQTDLYNTYSHRSAAFKAEATEIDRLARYQSFVDELNAPSTSTVRMLAASQLGLIPSEQRSLNTALPHQDPTLLEAIDAIQTSPDIQSRPISMLERISSNPTMRFVFVLIGAIALMYGILPPATTQAKSMIN